MFMDVVILCEINLNDVITNGELEMSDHKIYRKDRSQLNSQKISKGGVLIAVNSNYSLWPINVQVQKRLFICFDTHSFKSHKLVSLCGK